MFTYNGINLFLWSLERSFKLSERYGCGTHAQSLSHSIAATMDYSEIEQNSVTSVKNESELIVSPDQ